MIFSIRNHMVLLVPCFLLGLLGISDGYIYVPPKYTGSDFKFWLDDDNGDLTTNGAGILKAKLYADDDRTADGNGTVCDTDNRFTDEAATVICKAMGYKCAENWKLETTSANLPALIDNVECTNRSLPFSDCRYDRRETSCRRKISLKCGTYRRCQYKFFLVNSEEEKSESKSGFLIATNVETQSRGTVCDDNFDKAAALTICREMGHECAASWSSRNDMNEDSKPKIPIMLDDVTCSAKGVLHNKGFNESCFWKTESDCDHSEDIYLSCGCMLEEFKFFTVDEKNEPTKNGKGLLIAETKKGSHYGNEVRGTVCDDLFDWTSAVAICNSMNVTCSDVSFSSMRDSQDTIQRYKEVQSGYSVALDDVNCDLEFGCTFSTKPDCDQSEDIIIDCCVGEGVTTESKPEPTSESEPTTEAKTTTQSEPTTEAKTTTQSEPTASDETVIV